MRFVSGDHNDTAQDRTCKELDDCPAAPNAEVKLLRGDLVTQTTHLTVTGPSRPLDRRSEWTGSLVQYAGQQTNLWQATYCLATEMVFIDLAAKLRVRSVTMRLVPVAHVMWEAHMQTMATRVAIPIMYHNPSICTSAPSLTIRSVQLGETRPVTSAGNFLALTSHHDTKWCRHQTEVADFEK